MRDYHVGGFKASHKRNASVFINGNLHTWCKRYCEEHGVSFSQLVESLLAKLYSDNNGIFLAPGDKTIIDPKK
jgi:hypothetical protein